MNLVRQNQIQREKDLQFIVTHDLKICKTKDLMLVSSCLEICRIKNSLLVVFVQVDTEHQLHCNVSSGRVVPLKNSAVINSDSNTTA